MTVATETIRQTAWREYKEKLGRWYPAIVGFLVIYELVAAGLLVWFVVEYGIGEEGEIMKFVALVLLTPPGIFYLFFARFLAKAHTRFWENFATANSWSYAKAVDTADEKGVMFKRSGRFMKPMAYNFARNAVSGTWEGRPARIFEYQFTLGSGKSSETHFYTVFEFSFAGTFPHLYLNRKKDRYGIDAGKPLRLPAEFERSFELFAPDQYEVEALEIFTPDVLAYLVDVDWPFDLELIDQRLIVYREMHITSSMQLASEWHRAKALATKLAPVLDRVTYSPIGTHAPSLS